MSASPALFHLAFVVDSLVESMEKFGRALHIHWRDVLDYEIGLDERGHVTQTNIRSVYSAGRPVAIELVESIPGTVVSPVNGAAFHHIGQWAPELCIRSRAVEEAGYPLAATLSSDESPNPSAFALHDTGLGFYLELLDPIFALNYPSMQDLNPPL